MNANTITSPIIACNLECGRGLIDPHALKNRHHSERKSRLRLGDNATRRITRSREQQRCSGMRETICHDCVL